MTSLIDQIKPKATERKVSHIVVPKEVHKLVRIRAGLKDISIGEYVSLLIIADAEASESVQKASTA